MLMSVEQSVGETKGLAENLSHYHEPQMILPKIELVPPRWETGD
jgi:hypothetical protein